MASESLDLTFAEPSSLAPRGTLIVIPGRGEQPEVYRRFGTRIAVDAYRVHVLGNATLDEHALGDRIAAIASDAPTPLVLVGIDTGALLATRLVAEGRAEAVDALVLAGLPDPDQTVSSAPSWDEELDARTTCPTHRGRISDDLVTRGALYGKVPTDWFEAAALAKIGKPILALHGREDPISPFETVREAYSQAPRVELVGVAGARHDVLNDQSHRTTAATVVLWLERLRLDSGLALIASPEPLAVDVA